MTISAEEKARISRENGKKSRGARTQQGKERARMNALKDGLRAKTVALLHEDPEEITRLGTEWTLFVRPTNPAMRHLANDCTRANLLSDRCETYRQSQLEKQGEKTKRNWNRRQRARLKRLQKMLPIDPAETIQELASFGAGVQWMTQCLEHLLNCVNDRGYLLPEEHEGLIRLYGAQPRTEQLRMHGPAYSLCLYHYGCMPQSAETLKRLEVLLLPKNRPVELREKACTEFLPQSPEDCREALVVSLEAAIESSREEEERVYIEVDEPSLESALREASILEEPAARRLARSQSEAHRTFHRAWKELGPMVKARQEAEAEEEAEDSETDVATIAPNEPSVVEEIADVVETSVEDTPRTSSVQTVVPAAPAADPVRDVPVVAPDVVASAPANQASGADVARAIAPNEPSPTPLMAVADETSGETTRRTSSPKTGAAATLAREPSRGSAESEPGKHLAEEQRDTVQREKSGRATPHERQATILAAYDRSLEAVVTRPLADQGWHSLDPPLQPS